MSILQLPVNCRLFHQSEHLSCGWTCTCSYQSMNTSLEKSTKLTPSGKIWSMDQLKGYCADQGIWLDISKEPVLILDGHSELCAHVFGEKAIWTV